jgi:diacylglycerol kinase (ATP)
MKRQEPFSVYARCRSFGYAISGVKAFFNEEHNAILHLVATVSVIVLGFVFRVSIIEAGVLTLSIGFVWAAEIFNTAIEKMMDFISLERHPQIKYIKDISAAAVLIAAVAAAVTGLIVFIPKI